MMYYHLNVHFQGQRVNNLVKWLASLLSWLIPWPSIRISVTCGGNTDPWPLLVFRPNKTGVMALGLLCYKGLTSSEQTIKNYRVCDKTTKIKHIEISTEIMSLLCNPLDKKKIYSFSEPYFDPDILYNRNKMRQQKALPVYNLPSIKHKKIHIIQPSIFNCSYHKAWNYILSRYRMVE